MKKKRSKRSRLRGRRSCGYGARKKHRGKGSKGGKGMAGTGKRAGQKRTWVLKYDPDHFGKRGFTSLKKIRRKKMKTINFSQIQDQIDSLMKKGLGKKTAEGIELNLKNYKVLAGGDLEDKFIIKASSFSKKVEEKIKTSGSKIMKI
ncbi:MAG: uL15 family ribosomal protein [Candidatus Pacearchaeota archaeon]|nr:MAG: uL15 family ribosomal protein [Candidatus Pacearchaeota archaeon]